MQVAPEVIFNGVDRSAWVEGYVAERLQHLERFAQDITSCHVTLSRERSSQRKGNRYSVMVEVRVPPQHDLAVRKQKQIRDMQTQLPAIINEAFGAIETQLKRTIARRRHEEKAHTVDVDARFAAGKLAVPAEEVEADAGAEAPGSIHD